MTTRTIQNQSFDEIKVGDSASLTRTLTPRDIELFAAMSGDVNPAHLDPDYARHTYFGKVIAHGMWSAAMISAVLGTELPGPGTIYLGQTLRFKRPVSVGDTITTTLTVLEKMAEKKTVVLDCRCVNQRGEEVVRGVADVIAPAEKISRARIAVPEVSIRRHDYFASLVQRCAGLPPIPVAAVCPCDAAAIRSILDAANAGLVAPQLIGPLASILNAAENAGLSIRDFRIIDAPDRTAAAKIAVSMAVHGEVDALMQGSIALDMLLQPDLRRQSSAGITPALSQVMLIDVPDFPRPLLLADIAFHIAPTVEEKADICRNAIDVAQAIGIAEPKVAILSATDDDTSTLQSAVDAVSLAAMARRGCFPGAILDGPLSLDRAIRTADSEDRVPPSPVAGLADILIVPGMEAGSMLARQLVYLAHADAASVIAGAIVPIIVSSADPTAQIAVASTAIARLMSHS